VSTDSRAARTAGNAGEVSALFDDRAAVDRAVMALTSSGFPRDLIEVIVAPPAARRFYGGVARRPRREALRFAGIGGLVGLVLGAAIALAMLAVSGFAKPGLGALAQLLGPNVTTLLGVLVGGLIGAFVRRDPAPRHARAGESPEAILVVVRAGSNSEAAAVAVMLGSAGGQKVQTASPRGTSPRPTLPGSAETSEHA
jgi:hypothetical protein